MGTGTRVGMHTAHAHVLLASPAVVVAEQECVSEARLWSIFRVLRNHVFSQCMLYIEVKFNLIQEIKTK